MFIECKPKCEDLFPGILPNLVLRFNIVNESSGRDIFFQDNLVSLDSFSIKGIANIGTNPVHFIVEENSDQSFFSIVLFDPFIGTSNGLYNKIVLEYNTAAVPNDTLEVFPIFSNNCNNHIGDFSLYNESQLICTRCGNQVITIKFFN